MRLFFMIGDGDGLKQSPLGESGHLCSGAVPVIQHHFIIARWICHENGGVARV